MRQGDRLRTETFGDGTDGNGTACRPRSHEPTKVGQSLGDCRLVQ
jgi:hypothetical protein